MRFHCGLSGLNWTAPMDQAKRLFEDVNAVPTVLHAESPGAVPLEGPLAGSTPLTGRQAELVDCQAARLDTRRIRNSVASPTNQTRRTALYPPYRAKARTRLPVKGFLNRRFKHAFAYFWRGPKVGAESGAAQVPGQFEKQLPFAARRRRRSNYSP